MDIKVERGIPLPGDTTKQLVNFILGLKDGDSVYLSYDEFTKTVIRNCVINARYRLLANGLKMLTRSDLGGCRLWIYKVPKR